MCVVISDSFEGIIDTAIYDLGGRAQAKRAGEQALEDAVVRKTMDMMLKQPDLIVPIGSQLQIFLKDPQRFMKHAYLLQLREMAKAFATRSRSSSPATSDSSCGSSGTR